MAFVVKGILRNFGGRNERETLKNFSYLGNEIEYEKYMVKGIRLIRENFQDD